MRGLGKTQIYIRRDNRELISNLIKAWNRDLNQYATINDIHRSLKINKKSIRIHIEVLLEEQTIFEKKVHNNARGFLYFSYWLKLKNDDGLRGKYLINTENHINSLKFPLGKKLKLRKKRLKSGREIQSKIKKSRVK